LTGERRPPGAGRWAVEPSQLEATAGRLAAAVADAGPRGLDTASLDERDRAVLSHLDGIVVDQGRARPTGAEASTSAYVAALEASPFAPPTPEAAGADRAEVRELVVRGLVVERDGMFFAPSAVEAATTVVARLLAERPEGVTASAVREALGTSRKYLLPLLAHLDATGVTRRRGDLRVGGPRLP
jgi:selenocysteine-specific elongation factor